MILFLFANSCERAMGGLLGGRLTRNRNGEETNGKLLKYFRRMKMVRIKAVTTRMHRLNQDIFGY